MRSKIAVTVFVLGAVLLASAFFFHFGGSRSEDGGTFNSPAQQQPDVVAAQPSIDAKRTNQPAATTSNEVATATPVAAVGTNAPGDEMSEFDDEPAPGTPLAKQKEYVQNRINELMDLAMEDDSASLNTILSELNNPDPELRKAALEAAIQFGSRDAIPKLQDALLQTDDPDERAAIKDAIEFLKLPSLTEVLREEGKLPPESPVPGGTNGPR